MSASLNIRLIAIAAIYLLHIAFFDALMDNGYKLTNGASLISVPANQHSQNSLPEEYSYRLLTKHEESRQMHIGLPDFAAIISSVSTVIVKEHITQQQPFGAFAHLNESVFRLYRLFGVFLI
jgi:hypothetical protein